MSYPLVYLFLKLSSRVNEFFFYYKPHKLFLFYVSMHVMIKSVVQKFQLSCLLSEGTRADSFPNAAGQLLAELLLMGEWDRYFRLCGSFDIRRTVPFFFGAGSF